MVPWHSYAPNHQAALDVVGNSNGTPTPDAVAVDPTAGARRSGSADEHTGPINRFNRCNLWMQLQLLPPLASGLVGQLPRPAPSGQVNVR